MARRPLYQLVTAEITSATSTGVKEDLTLWHPSTSARNVRILRIAANLRVVQTAGTLSFELQYISAENGTPAGTARTPQPLYLGDPASELVCREVVTGAPTVAGQIFDRSPFPLPAASTPFVNPFIIYESTDRDDFEDAIALRAGIAEGLRITHNVAATLTTAPIFTLEVQFIEEPTVT